MMKRISGLITVGLVAGALMLSGSAMAHDQPHVNWSLSIGVPFYAAPVYTPPPAVYAQPQPVYMQPQPAYVEMESRPVVQYRNYYPRPYYGEEERYMEHRHWRHHHHYED